MSKTFDVTLRILTPVIIQSGEPFGPFEIIPLKDSESKGYLTNPDLFFQHMDASLADTFTSLLINGIKRRDTKKLCDARTLLYDRNILTQDVIRRPITFHPRALAKIQENPGLEVQNIATMPLNGKPYLPGSSIKGAIRTAILEKLRGTRTPQFPQHEKEFEGVLLGALTKNGKFSIKDDPFRFLKVTDFFFEDKKTNVAIGELISKKVPVYTAMTDAMCYHDFKEPVIAKGTITIMDKAPTYFSELFTTVSHFFIEKLNKKFEHQGGEGFPPDLFAQLNNDISQGYGMIRLGHYTGTENKTLNVQQRIGTKITDEDINIHGLNSFTLIEGKYPAGFCTMKGMEEK